MTTADRQRAEVVASVCGALRYLAEIRAAAARRSSELLQLLDGVGHDRGQLSALLAGIGGHLEELADEANRGLREVEGVSLADLVQTIQEPEERPGEDSQCRHGGR